MGFSGCQIGVLTGMFSSKRRRWPPIFLYISEISNSSSFNGKIFRKKSMLQTFARTSLKGCTKRKAFAEKETIGPSQDPVTWYGKKFYWDANNAVRLPKQRNSYQSSLTFLRFRSPTASVASQCNSFLTDVTGSCKGPIHLFQSWVW